MSPFQMTVVLLDCHTMNLTTSPTKGVSDGSILVLPYISFANFLENTSCLFRYSRNTFSERSSTRPKMGPDKKVRGQIIMNKDPRKVYPNQEGQWDQLYHEIQTP